MTTFNFFSAHKPFLSRRAAVILALAAWLLYSVLQTLLVLERLSEAQMAFFGFAPGLLAVGALLAAGFSRAELYLRVAPLSRRGLGVLTAVFVLALSVLIPSGAWQGWSWTAALVYAPASGVAQELFFRAALLPALLVLFDPQTRRALWAHAVLFSLWHIGPLFSGAPLFIVAAILGVTFVSGLGWGWQVQHDKTVIWAMIQHSLIWVIGLQFAYG
jgi:membrane protease YdiL (CAAX protease family)